MASEHHQQQEFDLNNIEQHYLQDYYRCMRNETAAIISISLLSENVLMTNSSVTDEITRRPCLRVTEYNKVSRYAALSQKRLRVVQPS